MSEHSLEVHAPVDPFHDSESNGRELLARLEDAIDLASDQDQMTWLTDHGKRIAAIVRVDVAEHHLADMQAKRDEMIKLGHDAGLSNTEIAKRMKISRTTVVAVLGTDDENGD